MKQPLPLIASTSAPDVTNRVGSPIPLRRQQSQGVPIAHASRSPRRQMSGRRNAHQDDGFQNERIRQWVNEAQRVIARPQRPQPRIVSGPPYPVTPPLEAQAAIGQPLGFTAPTTLPEPSTPPRSSSSRGRNCILRLDDRLRKLTFATLAAGAMLLVCSILFVRSVQQDTPHDPAGKAALLAWFCLSTIIFIVLFGLVLGILCYRARWGGNPDITPGTGAEIELRRMTSHTVETGVTSEIVRRNAISGPTRHPNASITISPSRQPGSHDQETVQHINGAPPSKQLSRVQSSHIASTYEQQLSPLPLKHLVSQGYNQQNASLNIGLDTLSTIAQNSHSDDSVSPRTVPGQNSVKQTERTNAIWNRSSLSRHSSSSRSCEIDDCSGCSNGTSIAAHGRKTRIRKASVMSLRDVGRAREYTIESSRESTSAPASAGLILERGAESSGRFTPLEQGTTRHGPVDIRKIDRKQCDTENQGRTASMISLRSVGKAREYIVLSSSAVNTSEFSGSPDGTTRGSKDIRHPRAQHQTRRRHRSMLEPLTTTPLLPQTQSHNIQAQRSRSLSPKKLHRLPKRQRPAGLGICGMRIQEFDEPYKENTDPKWRDTRNSEESVFGGWSAIEPYEGT